jgi:hypothetical protein
MQIFDVSYDIWKTLFINHSSSWSGYKLVDDVESGFLYTGNEDFIYTTKYDGNTFTDYSSSLQSYLTPVSKSNDAIVLLSTGLSNVSRQVPRNSAGVPVYTLETRQNDSTPLVAIKGRVGSETIYTTHNFCDKSTWYNGSVRVVSGTLTQSGSIWYHSASGYGVPWLDLQHGKLFDEEGLIEDQFIFAPLRNEPQHGYSIEVFVDGVAKTARAPFQNSGGDYTIDFKNGHIQPVTEDWAGQTVSASFSRYGNSIWYLEPLPNKVLIIEKAEVQFSKDIEFNTTFVMGVEGYASIFAPQLIQANGGPLPNDARITIEQTSYKTIDQLIDEAINAYPEIPAISTGSLRGFATPRHIFQFHYAAVRKIYSSLGMRVKITTENDISFGGERATATFYCISENDPGAMTALANMGLI